MGRLLTLLGGAAIGIALVGTRRLPSAAFAAGAALGRAVVFVRNSRSVVERVLAQQGLDGVRADLQRELGQLRRIRAELRDHGTARRSNAAGTTHSGTRSGTSSGSNTAAASHSHSHSKSSRTNNDIDR